jgi:excinuclease ABC subunit C
MCTSDPSEEHYSALVDEVIKLLRGNDLSILEDMEQNMHICASNFDFESAAKYRDYIRAVKHLTNTAKIISFIESNKSIALVELFNDQEFKFVLMRYNKMLFTGMYNLDDYSIDELKDEIKSNIMIHFSDALGETSNVGVDEIDEVHIIYNYLKRKEGKYKYLPIQQNWIDNADTSSIDRAVGELISCLI